MPGTKLVLCSQLLIWRCAAKAAQTTGQHATHQRRHVASCMVSLDSKGRFARGFWLPPRPRIIERSGRADGKRQMMGLQGVCRSFPSIPPIHLYLFLTFSRPFLETLLLGWSLCLFHPLFPMSCFSWNEGTRSRKCILQVLLGQVRRCNCACARPSLSG